MTSMTVFCCLEAKEVIILLSYYRNECFQLLYSFMYSAKPNLLLLTLFFYLSRDIFRKNGTAVDAAIAVLFCNGAVHSHSLGLGGGFFMTVYIKSENKSYFLNAREVAPLNASMNMFLENPGMSTSGPLAVAVPGELKGYVEAKNRFGNPDLSLMDIMLPTIELCENGFLVTRSLERAIKTCYTTKKYRLNGELKDKCDQNLMEEFTNPQTGKYFKKGETIKRAKYAATLRKIAESGSSDIFYKGEIGEKIVEEVQELGGILTMEDLKSYKYVHKTINRF